MAFPKKPDSGNRLEHLLDVQLAVNELNLQVEEPGSGSSLVEKSDGNIIAALAEPAGLAPVDLTQNPVVYPWVRAVGEFTSQKESEHGFAFLDLYITDRAAKVIRFADSKDGFFLRPWLAGPEFAHLDVPFPGATARMKPWLEIDAQDLVGHFTIIDLLGALHANAAGRAGIEVDGGDLGNFRDALLHGQGEDDLFLGLCQLGPRDVVPLDPAGFGYSGSRLLAFLCPWEGDGVQLNQARKHQW